MNHIRPVTGRLEKCRRIDDPTLISEHYHELLGDESRLRADRVAAMYLPENRAQAAWVLRDMQERRDSELLSAGPTSISGGAVPLGGTAVISLVEMNRLLGLGRDGEDYYIRVESGCTVAALQELLESKDLSSRCVACTAEECDLISKIEGGRERQLWFPVSPADSSARIGRIVSTNAAGSRSLRYGEIRDWVRALTVVLPDGRLIEVRRGAVKAVHSRFLLQNQDGSLRQIMVSDMPLPATKAMLDYPLKDEMDLIDLFIGSEGTLGIVVEVELRLVPKPPSVVGVLVAVAEEERALRLAQLARTSASVAFDATEYFDQNCLLAVQKESKSGGDSPEPEPPDWNGCAVYLEASGTPEQTAKVDAALKAMLAQAGIAAEGAWAASDGAEFADRLLFRHLVPEAVSRIIARRRSEHPGLHKVSADMAVPDALLVQLFVMLRRDLRKSGIGSVIFSHIGTNLVHVDLLPNDLVELDQARQLIVRWAQQVTVMHGVVSADHGIGRLKKDLLALQYTETELAAMQTVRRGFDPEGLLAPGVQLD